MRSLHSFQGMLAQGAAIEAALRASGGTNALDSLSNTAFASQIAVTIANGSEDDVVPPVEYVPTSKAVLILWSSYGVGGTGMTNLELSLESSDNGGVTWGETQLIQAAGVTLDGLGANTFVGASSAWVLVDGVTPGDLELRFRVHARPQGAAYACSAFQGSLTIMGLPTT